MSNEIGSLCRAQVGDIVVQDVPQTPMEALRIFRNPESEDWERDYAAMMITSLEEALPDLVATARDRPSAKRCSSAPPNVWPERGGIEDCL